MAPKKPAKKRRRPLKGAALPPKSQGRRIAWILGGMVFAFALGILVGTRQGWVEGHHYQHQEQQRWQVRELEDGNIVKHGLFEDYYADGKTLKERGDYFMGQKHGLWTEYDSSGKALTQTTYVNGILQ